MPEHRGLPTHEEGGKFLVEHPSSRWSYRTNVLTLSSVGVVCEPGGSILHPLAVPVPYPTGDRMTHHLTCTLDAYVWHCGGTASPPQVNSPDLHGISCNAQVLPSGSLKCTYFTPPMSSTSLTATPRPMSSSPALAAYDQVEPSLRPHRHIKAGQPGAQHDRARRTGRRELDDSDGVVRPRIMVEGESECFNVESDGAISIGNRDRYKLKFHIHRWGCSCLPQQ